MSKSNKVIGVEVIGLIPRRPSPYFSMHRPLAHKPCVVKYRHRYKRGDRPTMGINPGKVSAMAQRLVAVGNGSSKAAQLTSTEHQQDNCAVPQQAIQHTGGSDGDFIKIPDCSDSRYYKDYHILIRANDGSWTVSLWNNDLEEHRLYWNNADAYSGNNPVVDSELWESVSILIDTSGASPTVYASKWT